MGDKQTSTLEQIQDLSNEQQALWRLAGQRRLSSHQQTRLRDLKPQLARLWHVHRCEVAHQNRNMLLDDVEKRYESPVFIDHVDRMNDAVQAQSVDVERLQYTFIRTRQLDIIDLVQEALMLAREDAAEKKLAEERAAQHKMALRDLMAQRKETLRWEAGRASVVKL